MNNHLGSPVHSARSLIQMLFNIGFTPGTVAESATQLWQTAN
jgi:hypothetical protein